MMASWEARYHFLVFFLGAEDNNEPGGSSSSLGFFPQMQKMTRSWEVLVCCHLLGFSSSAKDEEEPIELFLLGRFKLLFFCFWIDCCLRI